MNNKTVLWVSVLVALGAAGLIVVGAFGSRISTFVTNNSFTDEICFTRADGTERCHTVGFTDPNAAFEQFESDIAGLGDIGPQGQFVPGCPTGDQFCDLRDDLGFPTGGPAEDVPGDVDGDGIPDTDPANDLDGDGIPNSQDDDIDGDGISNALDDYIGDPNGDVDGDGIPNYLDKEFNGDPNADSDGDGIHDAFDPVNNSTAASFPDADQDGIPDTIDNPALGLDVDDDGIADAFDDDVDGDGLPNAADDFFGDPDADSDFDGIANRFDPFFDNPTGDADGDGIENQYDPKFTVDTAALLDQAYEAFFDYLNTQSTSGGLGDSDTFTQEDEDFLRWYVDFYGNPDNLPPQEGELGFEEFKDYTEAEYGPVPPPVDPGEDIANYVQNVLGVDNAPPPLPGETWDEYLDRTDLDVPGPLPNESTEGYLTRLGLNTPEVQEGESVAEYLARIGASSAPAPLPGESFDDYVERVLLLSPAFGENMADLLNRLGEPQPGETIESFWERTQGDVPDQPDGTSFESWLTSLGLATPELNPGETLADYLVRIGASNVPPPLAGETLNDYILRIVGDQDVYPGDTMADVLNRYGAPREDESIFDYYERLGLDPDLQPGESIFDWAQRIGIAAPEPLAGESVGDYLNRIGAAGAPEPRPGESIEDYLSRVGYDSPRVGEDLASWLVRQTTYGTAPELQPGQSIADYIETNGFYPPPQEQETLEEFFTRLGINTPSAQPGESADAWLLRIGANGAPPALPGEEVEDYLGRVIGSFGELPLGGASMAEYLNNTSFVLGGPELLPGRVTAGLHSSDRTPAYSGSRRVGYRVSNTDRGVCSGNRAKRVGRKLLKPHWGW